MKKNLLLIFLLTLTIFIASADSKSENFHWYRSSTGTTAEIFPDIPDGQSPDDPDDPNPWIPTDPDLPIYWVLFAVNGNMEINNDAVLKGTPGWSIGSNSSSLNKVIIDKNPNIYNDSFYIGQNAIASEVIQGILGTRDWWQNQGEPKKSFYEKLVDDGFLKLTKFVNFNDPSVGFPLKEEHFYPIALGLLEERENLITTWDSNIIIEESGYYNNITINSNREITLKVGMDDLVLKIDNLSISGKINVESTVENPGRVFFFINNSSTIGSSSRIGNSDLADKIHFFYTGNNDLNISGTGSIYGTIYSLYAKVNLTGSGGVKNILSISNKEVNFSPSAQISLDSIYAKQSNITIGNTGKINNGIVTGGNNVNVSNVNSFHYIYAPKALITFGNTGHYVGSFIGNKVIIDNVVTIKGPPLLKIEKPIIPQPIISNGTEGDWLININIDSNGFTPVFAFPNNDGETSGLPQSVNFNKDYTFYFIFTMINDTTVEVSYTFDDGDSSTTITLGEWSLLLDDEDKPGQKKPMDMYKSIFHSNAEQGHGSHALRGLFFEYDDAFKLDSLTVDNDMDDTHDPDLRVYINGFSKNSNGDVINRNKSKVYQTDTGKGKKK